MREGEGSFGHADIQCLGTVWRDLSMCENLYMLQVYSVYFPIYPIQVVYNNPLYQSLTKVPCHTSQPQLLHGVHEPSDTVEVHHLDIQIFRTFLESRVMFEFQGQLWIGHRVILDRWKTRMVWSVQQIMGQTTYQHFRRIFSKGFGFSVRETGQSNLRKSSQQITYINLLYSSSVERSVFFPQASIL